jgi:hypothetical protein
VVAGITWGENIPAPIVTGSVVYTTKLKLPTYREFLDAKFAELRQFKRDSYARIFRYGRCKDYKTNPKWAGFSIPAEISKIEARFLRWNEWLIEKSQADGAFRDAVFKKCEDGIEGKLFWFDSFLHTYAPKRDNPNVKWVTRPIQERYIRWRHETVAIQKHGLCDKSRDVGASWCNVYDDLWWWLFDEFGNGNFLLGSYKEEYVDGKSDKALMPKIDYAMRKLPTWQVPDGYKEAPPWRTFKAIKHPQNNSLVEGEATNPNFGRGGRKRVVDFDEYAFWKDADKAKRSAGMNASCLMFTSTANGMGNAFADMRWNSSIRKFRMKWTWNPEYQEGRYLCQKGCIDHPDNPGQPHSVKYDELCEDVYHHNPVDIAQELDIDYIRSAGTPVFNTAVAGKCIQRLKEKRPKFLHVRLDYKASGAQTLGSNRSEWFKQARKWPVAANLNGGGPFRVHQLPLSCKDPQCACKGTGMHTYAVGGDVSQGLPHGDDSVLYVADLTVGAIVAEWCGRIPPEDLAIEWAKIIRFYGTSSGHWRDAFATIEANGPGLGVCHALEKLGVNQFISQSDAKLKRTWDNQLGYWIHAQNKYAHISEYLAPQIGRLEANGYPALYNPFIEFWEQTLTFVTHASQEGEINPDKPKCGAQRGKKDDRVMAMLALVYGSTMHFTKLKGHFAVPRKKPTAPNMNNLSSSAH